MNQRVEDINADEKKLVANKYAEIVGKNLDKLKEEEYTDPDKYTQYKCKVNGLIINLAQDGLCSFKELKNHSKNIKSDYELIRKDMFDCLVWPAYAMSINQMRYVKYKDRLDLTLIDIQKFYVYIKPSTELAPDIAAKIFKECELGRAYLFPHTFYWLRSFRNFNDFIKDRNLGAFVDKDENDEFIAKKWTNTEIFDTEYFNELLRRAKKHKKL